MGCRWSVAPGWQRKGGAGIRPSGKRQWGVVAKEGLGPQGDFHLPQSVRSTRRRQRGPQVKRSGGQSGAGAGGRWSDDWGTALEAERGGAREETQ